MSPPYGDRGRPHAEAATTGDRPWAAPGDGELPLSPAGGAASELLSLLLSIMPDAALAVDGDGRIVTVNGQAERLFGYPEEQLRGRPVELLIPERFRHEHRHQRTRYASLPRLRPMGLGLELYGRRQDGTELPVEISLAPIDGPDGPLVVAAVRDTTERKVATAAQAQLAAIVQSSLDAIIALDLQGGLTSWNPGASRLLGYCPEEIVGQHVGRLLPPDGSPELEELLHASRTGELPGALDTQWRTKDGTPLDLAISVSPLRDTADQLIGFSVLARDITTRKKAEAQLRRQERLQAATAEIRLSMLGDAPLDMTFDLICRRALELLEAASALVAMADDGGPRVAAGAGDSVALTGLPLDAPPGAVLEALAPGAEPVVAVGGDCGGLCQGPHVAAPIRSSRGPAGVLLVVRSPARPPFLPEEVALVTDLASAATLGAELAHAREDREQLLLVGDRERIARDLHDLVIQRLFGSGMGLQGVLPLIDNPTAAEKVATAVDDLDTTIREIRTAIFALQQPPAAGGGVRSELLQLVGSLGTELPFEPAVRFVGPVDNLVTDRIRGHVLAVAREALSNVARHAHATRAEIELSAGEEVVLVVTDNGVGVGEPARRSGLANMAGRAESLGGSLKVGMPAGGGTRLEWRVPAERM